jgi:hypothetical protein
VVAQECHTFAILKGDKYTFPNQNNELDLWKLWNEKKCETLNFFAGLEKTMQT